MTKSGAVSVAIMAAVWAALVGCPASSEKETSDQDRGGDIAAVEERGAVAAQNGKATSADGAASPHELPQTSFAKAEVPESSPKQVTAGRSSSDSPGAAGGNDASPSAAAASDAARQRDAGATSELDSESRTGDPAPARVADVADGSENADSAAQDSPLFVGWNDPQLVLVITGELMGFLEPCGCTGMENRKGGFKRRHTLLKELAGRGWPLAVVDSGGLASRFGKQAELKFQAMVDALRIMEYDAVGLGPADLRLPAGMLAAAAAEPEADRPSRFVCANVGLFDMESGFTSRFLVVEKEGLKIGVTSVLGETYRQQIQSDDVPSIDAAAALDEVAPQLEALDCDVLVLLSHATRAESIELARRFPAFQVVVTAGGADVPPRELESAEGVAAAFIEPGHKGMYVIALGFFDDPRQPLRYQRIELDKRFADSPEMQAVLVKYQLDLEQAGWLGLELPREDHPNGAAEAARGVFIGSEACADCHQAEYEKWLSTPHAHATESLSILDPPRLFDPECVSCHVTGWHPQRFEPYATGFDSLEATPLLIGNGCENCHGPGAAHVAAESEGDEELQLALRPLMRLTKEDARERLCSQCHDGDNDPHYEVELFDTEYWPVIEH